mmetsp:Transcript_11237/g.11263  ORF Transcript_11237/g.11263 Transcript_11237/m.11263 type:complete len:451 (-) Transcript_11237:213-1565(-)
MSYREIRNFTEMMRTLGYGRLISMENFRRPNFELVADILDWMVKLYDPDAVISDKIELESHRVEFLTSIATLMAAKARIKLNTKKLYASDGRAVQELLKLASLLYRATQSVPKRLEDEQSMQPIKVQDVKVARTLASDITQLGAKLYDLLASEAQNRQERAQAMRFLDVVGSSAEGSREHEHIARSLREIVEQTKTGVDDMRKETDELEADEKAIEVKIRKKQEELERTEKRLRSLENVRPQFMDEVEKLEKDLQKQYEAYLEKFRNLDYLENELEQYYKNEEERRKENELRLKKMRERLIREEVEILRGGGREDGDDETPALASSKYANVVTAGKQQPFQARTGTRSKSRKNGTGKAQVQGTMNGSDDEESSEDEDDISGESGDEDDDEISVSSRDLQRGGRGMGGRRVSGGDDSFGGDSMDEDDDDDLGDEDDDEEDDDDEDDDDDNF